MKYLLLILLILLLLNGCGSGKFSLTDGQAKYSIPLDWSGTQEEEIVKQEDNTHAELPE